MQINALFFKKMFAAFNSFTFSMSCKPDFQQIKLNRRSHMCVEREDDRNRIALIMVWALYLWYVLLTAMGTNEVRPQVSRSPKRSPTRSPGTMPMPIVDIDDADVRYRSHRCVVSMVPIFGVNDADADR